MMVTIDPLERIEQIERVERSERQIGLDLARARDFQGEGPTAMESIEEPFEHELKDILGSEHALVVALEQMAQDSSDRDIKKPYTPRRKETRVRSNGWKESSDYWAKSPKPRPAPGI